MQAELSNLFYNWWKLIHMLARGWTTTLATLWDRTVDKLTIIWIVQIFYTAKRGHLWVISNRSSEIDIQSKGVLDPYRCCSGGFLVYRTILLHRHSQNTSHTCSCYLILQNRILSLEAFWFRLYQSTKAIFRWHSQVLFIHSVSPEMWLRPTCSLKVPWIS